MEKIEIRVKNQEQTALLASKIAEKLEGNEIIFLQGQLGAGKTFLARSILKALGYEEEVVSPTFILQCEYRARVPVLHLDLYRLEYGEEIDDLGLEEYLDRYVWLVEWADRFPGQLPPPDLIISFFIEGEKERKIVMEGKSWVRSLKNNDFGD